MSLSERQKRETERYFEELSPQEALYQKVKAKLDASEQAHVEELRQRRLEGDRSAAYGHDLLQAISRARLREQIETAKVLLDKVAEERTTGSKSVVFAGALSALVRAAAAEGVSAEKMRLFLNSLANSSDSLGLESIVKRYGPTEE